MRGALTLVMAVGLTVALGACGGGDTSSTTAASSTTDTEERCVILVNGNKLCGTDAKSYCERFAVDTPDVETRAACLATGADVTSPEADAQAIRDEQGKKLDEGRAAANRERTAGAAQFDSPVKEAAGKDDMGYSFVHAVRTADTTGKSIVVSTGWYTKEEKVDPDQMDPDAEFAVVPSRARLLRVCDAIKKTDSTVTATIESNGNETLVTCP